MADEQSTDDATPAEAIADESVKASVESEAQETDDVDLEDIEISEAEIEETEEAEDAEEESPTGDDNEESEEDSKEEDAPPSEEQAEDETDEKQKAREYYKQRQAEREKANRQRDMELVEENVRLEQYLKEAEEDSSELTLRQAEVERLLLQREKVAMNEERLHIGIDKAVSSIDLFRTGTPEVKQELASAVDDFLAMYVETNKKGDPVAIHGDITAFLQKKADSIRRIQGVGVRQATKDKQATKARTVAIPSRAPKEQKVDKDLADFDDAWNT